MSDTRIKVGDLVELTDDAKKLRGGNSRYDVRKAMGRVAELGNEWIRVEWDFLDEGQTWGEHTTTLRRYVVPRVERRVLVTA